MRSKILFFILLLIFVLISILHNIGFASVEKLSREQLTNRANTILIGTVTEIASQRNIDKTRIFTFITISVETYIKGNYKKESYNVKIPGGKVGNVVETIPDVPIFKKDERVFLFLQSVDFPVVGWYQGKYTIKDDEIVGLKIPLFEFIQEIRTIVKKNVTRLSLKNKGKTELTFPEPVELKYNALKIEKKTNQPVEKNKYQNLQQDRGTEKHSMAGSVTIMSEDFEGNFPSDNGWTLSANNASNQDGYGYTWDDDDYKPLTGSESGWCANGAY